MVGEENMKQSIGEFFAKKVTLVVPTWASWVLIIGALLLIGLFILIPSQRSEIIFVTSVLAGVGVFLNAINGIFTRQAQAEQADRTLKAQIQFAESSRKESQRREALDLMKRWNDPAFTTIRHRIAVGFEKDERFVTKDSPPEELAQVNYVLNFLEMVAIACKGEDADPGLCRQFFKSAVLHYKKRLGLYMEGWRTARNQPTAFENLWALANFWET